MLWDLRHPSNIAVTSKFVALGGETAAGMINKGSRLRRRIPLIIDRKSSTIWVGHQSDLLGFSPEGGTPKHVLKGHLLSVTAVESMDQSCQLLSGSADGMILTWGKQQAIGQRSGSKKFEDKDNW